MVVSGKVWSEKVNVLKQHTEPTEANFLEKNYIVYRYFDQKV